MKRILLSLFTLTLTISSTQAQLNGSYTVGGASPDYIDVSAAVTDLDNVGVSGPVIFNIRPGTYSGTYSLPNEASMDLVNTVTFQAENGDSSSVVLNNTLTANTFNVNGEFYRLKNLNIKTNGRAVFLSANSDHLLVESCLIEGSSINSTSTTYALIYSSSSGIENITFKNNELRDGGYGFYIYGSSSSDFDGFVAENNNLIDQYYRSVYIRYTKNILFKNNVITTNKTYSNWTGFYIEDALACMISNNEITTLTAEGYGVYTDDNYGSATDSMSFINNTINFPNSANSYGIYMRSSSSYVNLYHNTINIKGVSGSGYASAYIRSLSNSKIYNNIFSSTGGDYSFYIANIGSSQIGNNNYYTTGNQLGEYEYSLYNDFSSYQMANVNDSNSLSVNPQYISSSDIHLSPSAFQLNGAGKNVGVMIDRDGESRTSTPDIGSDEFTPQPNNVGLFAINSPRRGTCVLGDSVMVSISNTGNNAISTLMVSWMVNGVLQPSFSYNNLISSYQTVSNVYIGSYSFSDGDSLVVWTSMPNGVSDTYQLNDTAKLLGIYTAISGTKTVGGISPDYNTFIEAISEVGLRGVCGPLTINLRPGTYVGKIDLGEVLGSSSINTITIQAEDGDSTSVILTDSTNDSDSNYVVQLNGADFITLNKLTFESLSTDYQRFIDFNNRSNNNTISSCVFNGDGLGNGNDFAIDIADGESNFSDSVVIENCIINNVYSGINLYGYDSKPSESIYATVKNNVISNYMNYGIYGEYVNELIIDQNIINTSYNQDDVYPIYLYELYGEVNVTNNEIIGSDSTYSSDYIYVEYSYGVLNFINNFIKVGGKGDESIALYYYEVYGLTNTSNNTIVNVSDHEDSYAWYNEYAFTTHKAYNNIFMTDSADVTCYFYEDGYGKIFTGMDNNNIYSKKANILVQYDESTQYNTVFNYSAINDWNNSIYADGNNISENTQFVAADDLHIDCFDTTVNDKGSSFANVAMDIDGEPRSGSFPDIGADEFGVPNEASFTFTQSGYDVVFTNTSGGGTDFSWDFGDGNTSTDEHPVHTYSTDEIFTVTLSVSNACGGPATSSQFIKGSVSILENADENLITIMPNPNNGIFKIQGEMSEYSIISLNGKVVARETLGNDLNQTVTIDLTSTPNGVYFVRVINRGKTYFGKVIKQ